MSMPRSDSVVLEGVFWPVDLDDRPGLSVADKLTSRPGNQRFGRHLVLLDIFLRAVEVRVEDEGEPTGGCLLIHWWIVVIEGISS